MSSVNGGILELMYAAPESQLDRTMQARMLELKKVEDVKEQTEGLFDAVNMIVHGGLASDLIVVVLGIHLESVCKSQGYDYTEMCKESISRMEKEIEQD